MMHKHMDVSITEATMERWLSTTDVFAFWIAYDTSLSFIVYHLKKVLNEEKDYKYLHIQFLENSGYFFSLEHIVKIANKPRSFISCPLRY